MFECNNSDCVFFHKKSRMDWGIHTGFYLEYLKMQQFVAFSKVSLQIASVHGTVSLLSRSVRS